MSRSAIALARATRAEPLELGERGLMRDPRGCRIYARLVDANGAVVMVKQATVDVRDPVPSDRCWIFYDSPRENGPRITQPLLDPAQIRILIGALERHLEVVAAGAGADRSSPLFDFEIPAHVLTFFPSPRSTTSSATSPASWLIPQCARLAHVLEQRGRGLDR